MCLDELHTLILEAVLGGGHPQLGQPHGGGLGEGCAHVGERGPVPQPERLRQCRRRVFVPVRREFAPALCGKLFEAVRVHLAGGQGEAVAHRQRLDHRRRQGPAQSVHQRVQGVRVARGFGAPDVLDEGVGGHRAAR